MSDDLDHLSPAIWCFIFCAYAAAWAALPLSLIHKEEYLFFGQAVCSISLAGPVNVITKIFSLVSWDPNTGIPANRAGPVVM